MDDWVTTRWMKSMHTQCNNHQTALKQPAWLTLYAFTINCLQQPFGLFSMTYQWLSICNLQCIAKTDFFKIQKSRNSDTTHPKSRRWRNSRDPWIWDPGIAVTILNRLDALAASQHASEADFIDSLGTLEMQRYWFLEFDTILPKYRDIDTISIF